MTTYQDFLFVTADADLTARLSSACAEGPWTFVSAPTSEEALTAFDRERFRGILVDAGDAGLRGLQILEWMRSRSAFSALAAIFRGTDGGKLSGALASGAADCIGPGECSDPALLARRLGYVLRRYEAERALKVFETRAANGAGLSWVGESPAVRHALERALAHAGTRAPVLIRGAPGSGTERLARIIAARAGGAEFWFHPDDADGGAQLQAFSSTTTALCAAGRGVLCVEEAGNLSSEVQESLAGLACGRGLECGGKREFPDAKIVITSASDLELFVRAGRFRQDLHLMLAHDALEVPALAERKGDLPFLAAYFLEREFSGGRARYFSDDALAVLQSHEWPGNVTEFKALVRGVAASVQSPMIKAKDLPSEILEKGFYVPASGEEDWREKPYVDAKRIALNKFNREYISELLSRANNNLTVAAEKAGMDRSNFKKIIKKYFPDDD